jgi:hypothetical protein
MQADSNEETTGTRAHDELAWRILEYLQAHPDACDNVEGVARWWLTSQQVSESVRRVEGALEELRLRGLVGMRVGSQARRVYFACAAGQAVVDEPEQS